MNDLSAIVANEQIPTIPQLAQQFENQELLDFLSMVERFYSAVGGICNFTYLGTDYDFAKYEAAKERGSDPLGRMKDSISEIPRRNNMSETEWARNRMASEIVEIIENAVESNDDADVAKFLHHADKTADAIKGAYSWARRSLKNSDKWTEEDLQYIPFFDIHQEMFAANAGEMKLRFNSMSPTTQQAVSAWLGEVFYINATRYGAVEYRFHYRGEMPTVTTHVHKLPDFTETVEAYVGRRRNRIWEDTKPLQREFYLRTGDNVLSALGLQRTYPRITSDSTPQRVGFFQRLAKYLSNQSV